MPLFIAPLNMPLEVVALRGDEKVIKHLESLGICRGQTLEVFSSSHRGLVLKVKESRLAVDYDVAKLIEVIPSRA